MTLDSCYNLMLGGGDGGGNADADNPWKIPTPPFPSPVVCYKVELELPPLVHWPLLTVLRMRTGRHRHPATGGTGLVVAIVTQFATEAQSEKTSLFSAHLYKYLTLW